MNFTLEIEDFFNQVYLIDSLAYLGLSTKVENPFRDQLAFFLHQKYSGSIVSREYSNGNNLRVDLAILNESTKSKEFIEFKACYAFDLINGSNDLYKRQISSDNNKYKLEENTNVTFILLSIRTDKCPEKKYDSIVKYLYSMRPAYKKYSADEQRVISIDNVRKWFSDDCSLKLMAFDTKNLGEAFGVQVYLDYFIIK